MLAGACGTTSGDAAGAPATGASGEPRTIVLFSRTEGFRHSSIEPAVEALRPRLTAEGFAVVATEDPDALQGAVDGVAVVALDHPSVREAIDDLVASGVTVVTLVSDAPRSRRAHYVGIDNTAAGRTAASLLGRFVAGRKGKVGLVAGSMALRDHIERQIGFEQVISRDFPGLTLLPVREGRDDDERVEEVASALLAEHPDLVGLYNVGAGNGGIVAALDASGRARDVVFIAHELTPFSRRHLIRGTIDAVINQDPGHEARSATRLLIAEQEKAPIDAGQERIRIDIFIRDNVP